MGYLRLTLHLHGSVDEKPTALAIAQCLVANGLLTEGEVLSTSGDDYHLRVQTRSDRVPVVISDSNDYTH